MRSETGRAFMAVRDMDVAAAVIGIPMMQHQAARVRDQLVLLRRRRRALRLLLPRHGRAGGVHPRPLASASCS